MAVKNIPIGIKLANIYVLLLKTNIITMKPTNRDYTLITVICLSLGVIPTNIPGIYTIEHTRKQIDLSDCSEDSISIARTCIRALANA